MVVIFFIFLFKGIITYKNPYIILKRPLLSTLEVIDKRGKKVSYFIKDDTLFINDSIGIKDTFFVFYEEFFYKKDTVIFIPQEIRDIKTREVKKFRELDEKKDGRGIKLNGKKNLSAGFTEDGFDINESLYLNLKGNLGKETEIRGVVRDEGYPEKGGFTRELHELEEAFLQLKSTNFSFKLGEIRKKSRYYDFDKGILGLSLDFKNKGNELSFAIGYPKGEFRTVYIELKGDKNSFFIVDPLKERIVPGSERVYLNGKILLRGDDKDYIIDYENGIITFTSNTVFNSYSRLRVDFEVVRDEYSKWVSFMEGSKAFKFFDLNFFVFYHTDVKNIPKSPLTHSDILYLSQVEDTGYVLLPGIEVVDSGKGSYVLKGDTVVYIGKNKGNIIPSFVYVGALKGNYEYLEEKGYYVYVGENNGSYKIGRWGITPKSFKNLSFSIYKKLEFIDINLISGISEYNRNLFNNKYQKGFFYKLKGNFYYPGFISPGIDFRLFERDNFRAPYRVFEPDFFYFWNRKIKGNFVEKKISPYIDFKKIFKVGIIYSDIKNMKNFYRKYGGFYEFNYILNSKILYEKIFYFKNDIERFNLNFKKDFKNFSFSTSYLFERDTLSYKKVEKDIGFYVSFEENKIGYRFKRYDFLDEDEVTHAFIFGYNQKKISVQGNLKHVKFKSKEENSKEFYYFSDIYLNPFDNLHLTLRTSRNKKREFLKTFEYIYVGKGRGNFSYDSTTGVFYPDPEGSYIQKFFDRTLDVESEIRDNKLGITFMYNSLNFNFTIENSGEKGSKHSLLENYNLFIGKEGFLNPSLYFLKSFNKTEFFDNEFFLNDISSLGFFISKDFKTSNFESGIEYSDIKTRSKGFEERRFKFKFPFSYTIYNKNASSEFKLSPFYELLNIFKPLKEKLSKKGTELFFDFKFKIYKFYKVFLNLGYILQTPIIREYLSDFEKDGWRYELRLRIERRLTTNLYLVLRSYYRKGQVSNENYRFFIEGVLNF